MDRDKDAKLTYEEFVEGSKQDPTIVQVRSLSSMTEAGETHEAIVTPGFVTIRWTCIDGSTCGCSPAVLRCCVFGK